MNGFNIPHPPEITEEQFQSCRNSGDFCPIMFEWYKFVGQICSFFSCIRPDSPAFLPIEPLHHAVLMGLLNRCSRLMLSNVVLSHNGLHGETTSILDRCIFESCIKISWLCDHPSKDKFEQYIADGLKTELKFKDNIKKNISDRDNNSFIIEDRMLKSIDVCISSSGLSEEQINSMKPLPNLSQMMEGKRQELFYIVGQKIGSHHIHGTWPSLLFDYIQLQETGFFSPKDHASETHVNQYIIISLLVLRATEIFVNYLLVSSEDKKNCLELINAIKNEILKINKDIIGNDFEFNV